MPSEEPTRRQMRLSDIAPNFRCRQGPVGPGGGGNRTLVEIPLAYSRYVQSDLPSELRDAINRAVDGLCRKSPNARAANIYDESADDGRSTVPGWLVPLADWTHAMRQPLDGWYVDDAGASKD